MILYDTLGSWHGECIVIYLIYEHSLFDMLPLSARKVLTDN